MSEEKKENAPKESTKKFELTEKVRNNPWMVSTLVSGVLVLILLVMTFSGGITGNAISEKSAGEKLLSFYESMGITGLSIASVKEVSGLYEINFNYQGQVVPMYVTKDGKLFTNSISPLELSNSPTTQTKEIPKTDKPSAELFIWSYCPYGVEAQKSMIDVISLLRSKVDFKVVLFHDGHGAHETQQNKIQACIQKYDSENYWNYMQGFVNNIYSKCGASRDVACDKTESISLMKSLGIDDTKIMSCVSSEGTALFNADIAKASSNGVSGSPTLIVNGVESEIIYKYNPEATKEIVCSAFNNEPAECSTTLTSSGSTTPIGSC